MEPYRIYSIRGRTIKKKCSLYSTCMIFMLLTTSFTVYSCHGNRTIDGESTRRSLPPNAPLLVFPPNGTKGLVGDTINLQWEGSERERNGNTAIDEYMLRVSTSGPPYGLEEGDYEFNGSVGNTTNYLLGVSEGMEYYWTVKARDQEGWGPWASYFYFKINSRPEVTIESVEPELPRAGKPVHLEGKASDDDGDLITQYYWSSNEDGTLGRERSVNVTLSAGDHNINFMAMDGHGEWSLPAYVDITVILNQVPSKPANLSPLKFHDPKPLFEWSPSMDPEGDEIHYNLSIGTELGTKDIIESVFVTGTSYQLGKELEYEIEVLTGGEYVRYYYLSLTAVDEYGERSQTLKETLRLVNHPPDTPIASLGPREPDSAADIELTVENQSKDSDMDNVTHAITWTVDNGSGPTKLRDMANHTIIPHNLTFPGQIWRAEVKAFDGTVMSEPVYAETEIMNSLPQINISSPSSSDRNGDGLVDSKDWHSAGDRDDDGIPDNIYFVGREILFNASETRDKDMGQVLTYHWDMGDGSREMTGDTVTHVFTQPGIYSIVLTVTDGMEDTTNLEQDETIIIRVIHPPPELRIEPALTENRVMLEEGKKNPLTLKLSNTGEGPAANLTVTIKDMMSGKEIFQEEYHGLEGGESKIITVQWKADSGSGISIEFSRDGWTDGKTINESGSITSADLRDRGYVIKEGNKASDSSYSTMSLFMILLIAVVLLFIIVSRKKGIMFGREEDREEHGEKEEPGEEESNSSGKE